ncbi:MAG: hypothetical protein Q9180_003149, partial [Flavoplaca navasiana]
MSKPHWNCYRPGETSIYSTRDKTCYERDYPEKYKDPRARTTTDVSHNSRSDRPLYSPVEPRASPKSNDTTTAFVHQDRQRNFSVTNSPSSENLSTPTSVTRRDSADVSRIRGIAKPTETKQPASSQIMQADAAMAPPVEASGRKSRFDAIEKTRPQAPKPITPAEGPSLGIEAFRTALYQCISSIADVANKQTRCDALIEDEQQVVKERARWSKYADTFPTIGEDQARSLRALQQARNQSQSQINEAKKESEEAIDTIVKIIFATSIGSRMPADITVDSTATKLSGHSEEVINLKEEIASLRLQYSRNQERYDQELSETRSQLERRVNAVESNLREKLAQESARVRKLTEVNTKLEGKLE